MTAKNSLLTQQLRTNAVLDSKILSLYDALPREEFVPEAYRAVAYADFQIPLPFGQYMMTPLEESLLLQSLSLTGTETVLEIGTGTGFLTALLSRLCKKVISLEIQPSFIDAAEKKLSSLGCHNVQLIQGNAYNGWPDLAPYDCILLTGAEPHFNALLHHQLAPHGRLFSLIGQSPAVHATLFSEDLPPSHATRQGKFIFSTSLPELTPLHPAPSFVF